MATDATDKLLVASVLERGKRDLDGDVVQPDSEDELGSKTMAIVGFGRIGQRLAGHARSFDMNVIGVKRHATPLPGLADEVMATERLHEALARADVVVLTCPLTAETMNLMNAAAFAAMKPGAYLVNTARGDIVDEAALAAALASGRLAGAGLDVFAEEPTVPQALLALPNVTLLPHIGSATIETRTAMGMLAVDNLVAFFAGEPLPSRVA